MRVPTRRDLLDLPAELLLVATTLAALVGFDRIFSGPHLRPLVITTIVVHLTLIVTRRLGAGVLLSALASLIAFVVQINLTHYRDLAPLGLPNGDALEAAELDLRGAWQLFQEVIAPVTPVTGFLVATSLAIWMVALLADWAAFRLRSAGEALLPGIAIIIFIALFGNTEGRARDAIVFLACAVAFVLTHRAADRAATGTWLGAGRERGYLALVGTGILVGLVAIIAGSVGGPTVPGAEEEALVQWRELSDGETAPRKVISPLVHIRDRLVDQTDQVVMEVTSPQPLYWRVTSLDTFDGLIWKSNTKYGRAGDSLPVSFPTGAPVETVEQRYSIFAINDIWVPSASTPVTFEPPEDVGIIYEADSETLVVGSDVEDSNGISYTVGSSVTNLTPAIIDQLASTPEDDIDPRYLELPDDFSAVAAEEAERVTAPYDDPYRKALALQNYFRETFTYDLEVAKGHDINSLESFLEIRRGYCEQFAGTFAAMARSIGLPARVAVGFTWGERSTDDPNTYVVRGEHAHAWAEVYLPGAGWVLFDPTPGRGAPGTESYTGVPAQQDTSGPSTEPTTPEPVPEPTAEEIPAESPETALEDLLPDEPEFSDDEVPADALAGSSDGFSLPRPVVWLLLAMLAAVAALLGIPTLKKQRRRAELERATSARERIGVTWKQTQRSMSSYGAPPASGETYAEYAQRASDELRLDPTGLDRLSSAATTARFGPSDPADDLVDTAVLEHRRIESQLESRLTRLQRLRRDVDPRPLFRRSDAKRVKETVDA